MLQGIVSDLCTLLTPIFNTSSLLERDFQVRNCFFFFNKLKVLSDQNNQEQFRKQKEKIF
jgi:hypothetical protein